ncbi:MAG: TIGR03084 family metal-binding protein [Phycicoccus sp.]
MSASEVVTAAFRADGERFAALVDDIDEAQWEAASPAPGWSVKDQVGHVAFVFDIAALACANPAEFGRQMKQVSSVGFDAAVDAGLEEYAAGPGEEVLARWRSSFERVAAAIGAVEADTVPWLVRRLPPDVLTMAGMLEMFAHGQDVADALHRRIERTDTLAFLVQFIARTRDFGYESHGLTPPEHEFRFEVTLPSGSTFTVGPEDSEDLVTGSAEDLCLLAARRRHPDDLDLRTSGPHARQWLPIAQAYRGPAGPGRAPQRAVSA